MIEFPIPVYDRKCRPINFEEWLALVGDPAYQQVALTKGGGYGVSTVWLWFDQSGGMSPVPLIFETMVFGPGGKILTCVRYPTEEAALEGHRKVCERYANELATTRIEAH